MSSKSDKKKYECDFLYEEKDVKSDEIFDEIFLILKLFSDDVGCKTKQGKPSIKGKRSKNSLTQSIQSNQLGV